MIRRPVCVLLAAAIALLLLAAPLASASPSETRTITAGHSHPPKGGTTTTGQGLRSSNGNAQLAENIPSRVRRSWAVSPQRGICPYNGSEDLEFTTRTTATNGKYTVALHNGRCDIVMAYRTSSGKPVWSAVFLAAFALVSDGSYVYVHWEAVVHDDMTQFVSALKISTGKVRWTRESDADQDEISVGSGVVVHSQYVFDAKTGRLRFFTGPTGGSDPRTLVIKGLLIRNNSDAVSAWTPKGKLVWRYTKPSSSETPGAGSSMPQYNAGRLYIRGTEYGRVDTLVLDVKSGRRVSVLPPSQQPLAFDGRVAIFSLRTSDVDLSQELAAVDLADGYVYWTRPYLGESAGDNAMRTPPVIENGLVWVGLERFDKQPPRLIALDEVSGATRARISETCRLSGHAPTNSHLANGTIGIAQHRLFVPSACGLQTYLAQK